MLVYNKNINKCYWRGREISIEEYEHILSIIREKPIPPVGKDYRLTDSLTWELVDLPPEPVEKSTEDQLAEANEALEILTGKEIETV